MNEENIKINKQIISFSDKDMERFSYASHDRSPLHMDNDYTKNTVYGETILFGFLGSIGCLGRIEKKENKFINKVEIQFPNPMYTNKDYDLTLNNKPEKTNIKITNEEDLLLSLTASFENKDNSNLSVDRSITKDTEFINYIREESLDYSVEDLSKGIEKKGIYKTDKKYVNELKSKYLSHNDSINNTHIDTLMLCSYIAGMILPGRRSLCLKLNMEFNNLIINEEEPVYTFRAKSNFYDENFGILGIDISLYYKDEAVSHGELQVLVREEKELIKDNDNKNAEEIKKHKIAIASTFTSEPLESSLKFWENELDIPLDIEFAPYNQVFQELLNPNSLLATNNNGMNVILLRFDDWLRYKDNKVCISGDNFSQLTLEDKQYLTTTMDNFVSYIKSFSMKTSTTTMILLCPSTLIDEEVEVSKNLEDKLSKELVSINSINLIKVSDYNNIYEAKDIFDPMRDKMGHVPFTDEYYNMLGTLITRRFYQLINKPYKVIVLDCDNTLWEGVCGEAGPKGVLIENAFSDFHNYLINQMEQGVLLCLCSKNVEEDVWQVFELNENMILKKDHITDSKINWQPKSKNIKELAKTLNLGLDSFIFIDDNPVECAEVRGNCPEVLTIQWPKIDSERLQLINHLWYLDHYTVTKEDKMRTKMYQANVARVQLQETSNDYNNFLESLNLKVNLDYMTEETKPRVSQLTQRTNQFNFTTIRRKENEIEEIIKKGYEILTVDVEDKFGSYGLVGVMIVNEDDDYLNVDSFMLSCRVLGRGVEHKMMSKLGEIAKEKNLNNVKINFSETPKNLPAKQLLEDMAKQCNTNENSDGVLVSSELLSKVSMNTESMITTKKKANSKPDMVNSSTREKEKLLNRIYLELYNTKNLTNEINGYSENKTISNCEVVTSSEKINKDENIEDSNNIYKKVVEDVIITFSKQLDIPIEEIKEDDELEGYHIDSFKIMDITVTLGSKYEGVPSTLLFEHRNIKSIANFLIECNKEKLQNKYKTVVKDDVNKIETTKYTQKIDKNNYIDNCNNNDDDIAVIGVNGLYPNAKNKEELWEILYSGQTCISEINRWDMNKLYDPTGKELHKSYSKWGAFIEDIDCFEPSFFSISPREAELMDPQQRLFLQVVWGLLEDAGYTAETMDRNTGVFAAVVASDYATYVDQASLQGISSYRDTDFYQIPNRISYFFNFIGPSLALNTACSGSGTAIHLAYESLRKGDCNTAIVGGINLFIHPSRWVQYARIQFHSPDGICRPFGKGANGTVFGEGVGAVLLKRLSDAKRDKDNIYGIIRGTAINSGGKTNGFTVPNPKAQAELITKAIKQSKVDPKSISYVEAHGTGTSLGDPIEVRGLTMAFKENIDKDINKPFCAIGSIKPNLGHSESAAAMSGLIKVLLQMKYSTLVPSLNAEEPNPRITFENSPFYVQKKAEKWQRTIVEENGKQTEYPLRAGLSSFGAGGSNSHIIIEEYIEEDVINEECDKPQIIIISSKDEKRLKQLAISLVNFLEKNKVSSYIVKDGNKNIDLKQIAYTLQMGRKHMDERTSFVVSNIDELIKELKEYIDGNKSKNIYSGNIKDANKILQNLYEGSEIDSFIDLLISGNKLNKLAQLWTLGVDIDWGKIQDYENTVRVSLPGYNFEGERFWVPEYEVAEEVSITKSPKLHPLIEKNTSTLDVQKFTTIFNGTEFFLADHVIGGNKIFPGVAYIEMARAAGELSGLENITKIKDIIWTRPIKVIDESEVSISLYPSNDYVEYEVSSSGEEDYVVHGQGRIMLADSVTKEAIDIEKIKGRCTTYIDKDEYYKCYEEANFEYGNTFKAIKEAFVGNNEALVNLEFPVTNKTNLEELRLHPTLMDGALQSVAPFIYNDTNMTYLPFSVGEINVIGELQGNCYAHAILAKNTETIKSFNINIIDEEGNVLIKITNYSLRAMKNNQMSNSDIIYYNNKWEKKILEVENTYIDSILIFEDEDIIYNELNKMYNTILVKQGMEYKKLESNKYEINPSSYDDYISLIKDLKGKMPSHILHLWSNGSSKNENIEEILNLATYSVTYLVKAILQAKINENVNFIYGYSIERKEDIPYYEANSSLLKSICLESSKINYKTIGYDSKNELINNLNLELKSKDKEILYKDKERLVKTIDEVKPEGYSGNNKVLKENGVYIITGGTGGLGLIFAEYLAKEYKANLILTGRSELNNDKKLKLENLKEFSSDVTYIQADITNADDVEVLIKNTKEKYKEINGIIHSAGVIKDAYLINKTKEMIEGVLAPKVKGTVLLNEATRNEKLDFFVMFSSISGVLGNGGQIDYSYANSFMDNYAELRNKKVTNGECFGKSVAINWPLWRDGGMKIDKQSEIMIEKNYGMKLFDTSAGIRTFELALLSPYTQLMVMEGDKRKIDKYVNKDAENNKTEEEKIEKPKETNDIKTNNLSTYMEKDLVDIVSKILKIDENNIDLDEDMSSFGFDSISFTEFSNMLNEKYDLHIMPSIFYEHSTLMSLARYFKEEYGDVFASYYSTKLEKSASTVMEQTVENNMTSYQELIKDKLTTDLKQIVSHILKLNTNDIDLDEDMSAFGFDSISFTEFSNKLNDKFDLYIMPSVFYEHATLISLVNHLLDEYEDNFKLYYKDEIKINKTNIIEKEVAVTKEVDRELNTNTTNRRFRSINNIQKIETSIKKEEEPIAIVGVSAVMPGSDTIEEFWNNLVEGKDLISEVPKNRWDWEAIYGDPMSEANKTNVKWGGFIEDGDKFDPRFFGISPREAELMDPQQRVFLETVWKTIEDAGYKSKDIAGTKTGVFVGVATSEYGDLLKENQVEILAQTSTGKVHSILANRISYLLNLHGPSEPIDTACSSALTAVHRAVEEIQLGNCEMAIAGGVNILASPDNYISFSKAGMLCEDGRCKTFDKDANGYVRGEGAGAILLKPLSKAIEDNDHIYGLVKGSHINHGGHVNSLTTPNPNAQSEVIINAWRKAGVDPTTIGYIEAHGTGTSLGDPIEINGLKKAFNTLYSDWNKSIDKAHCGIGSIKTNIGHLETAAGIAGLIKALLAINNKKIPASINFNELNPYIQLESSPFYLVNELKEWESVGPRRAGISSFGFGGTNSHVVIEEYISPSIGESSNIGEPELIVLSAKNEDRLKDYAKSLLKYIEGKNKSLTNLRYEGTLIEKLKEDLSKIAANIIDVSIEDISSSETLDEYGFDPVNISELYNMITEKFHIEETFILNNSFITIENIVKYLVDNYREYLTAFYPDNHIQDSEIIEPNINLSHIAYTLQIGRDEMAERLAFVATDVNDLKNKLDSYINNTFNNENIYVGSVANKNKTARFVEGEEGKLFVNALVQNKKLDKIAQLFIAGGEIEWTLLHEDKQVKRISLPTYPFARERYWVPEKEGVSTKNYGTGNISKLHPLIDKNISTLEEQKFQTIFSGEEFFLAHHVIGSKKLLPGVTYIEMARKAAELSGVNNVIKIKDIVWSRPIVVDDLCEVNIGIYPMEDSIEYEISTIEDDNSILNGQGRIIVTDKVVKEKVNIVSIKDRCIKEISKESYYKKYIESGYEYGESFQGISRVYVGQKEALSYIELPNNVKEDFNEFILHPSIMDGALQTVASLNDENDTNTYLPFAIGEVVIVDRLRESCYAYATLIDDNNNIKKFNIDILDEEGNTLVNIIDFSLRSIQQSDKEPETIYYINEWKESNLIQTKDFNLSGNLLIFEGEDKVSEQISSKEDNIIVKIGEKFNEINNKVFEINSSRYEDYLKLFEILGNRNITISNILHLWNSKDNNNDITDKLETGVYSIYHITRALIQNKISNKINIIYGYKDEPYFEAVNSFLKTVSIENTKIDYKTIAFNTESNLEISNILKKELMEKDKYVLYLEGNRYSKELIETKELDVNNIPIKNNGVYIITGGTGGLGLIFASYLAKNNSANIVLTSRSNLTNEKKEILESLNKFGSEVSYIKADISKKEETEKLINKVKEKYGNINGIIHSAGVLRDSYLINKSEQDMKDVLSAKVYGTICLDELTKDEELDLFVMFSSVTATLGNAGQVDYAYANGFMDSYAVKRNKLVKDNKRSGKTVSINWPLWRDGGMKVDNQTEIMLEKNSGMYLLETEAGIHAFEQSLTNPSSQFMVVYGDKRKINNIIKKNKKEIEKTVEKILKVNDKELLNKLEEDLKVVISKLLKLEVNDIDINEDMSSFGFDSITFTEFGNKLNSKYKLHIIPSVFYEHTTLISFVNYLFDNYYDIFTNYYKETLVKVDNIVIEESNYEMPKTKRSIKSRFTKEIAATVSSNKHMNEPVAIIGVSGLMPGSKDLNEFWDNIEKGKNLIREIPEDRWDWKEYYGDPAIEGNKTNIKWGGFMNEIDKFDPLFFGISPREAVLMDPQHRLFLESVWSSIEDAGYKVSDVSGTKTGVFVGAGAIDYKDLLKDKGIEIQAQTSTGTAHSVLANRVSYLLNLHGPSEPVDTACSSSLVALHRAVEEIQQGNCEMAIAGGVQVLASPDLYIAFSKAGMLCEDGKCKTFDKNANGYVRGEGCGALLLKPLSKAIEDNDNIYAVVKGSAINHGGHVNTLTTPNPNAQSELIVDAWNKSGIDPTTITYIEAHGTGTALGDPIEINGLKKAFTRLFEKWEKPMPTKPYCGIGSVKTNIGHLETAAGIAGIIKVILAMKNKKIPASINFEEQNPYIQIEDSPFYIVDKTIKWDKLKDSNGNLVPRRAGISSFGFGGVNAHIVLEEFEKKQVASNNVLDRPYIITLSAKDKDRLKDYAKEMIDYVDRIEESNNISLADIEYTLQVGREEMEERLSLLVSDFMELRNKLKDYINDNTVSNLYTGNVRKDKENLDILISGDKAKEVIKSIIKDKEYNKLAKLWASGAEVNWYELHNNINKRRISLPTYPFARERYWINNNNLNNNKTTEKLHPLVESNTSNFYEQKFSTKFNGAEFYLKDHIVDGEKMLPGVAYMEMANVAGKISLDKDITIIKDILWAKPITVNEEKEVQISLQTDGEVIDYEVVSIGEDSRTLYSQGKLLTNVEVDRQEHVDIKLVKERCQILNDSNYYYELFTNSGLSYGASFRTIQEIYSGETEALTKVSLPSHLVNEFSKFELHPSIMDGALQSVIGIQKSDLEGKVAHIPLGMEEVIKLNPLQETCYVHVTLEKSEANNGVKKYNIDIVDDEGLVLIKLKGFMVKALHKEPLKVEDNEKVESKNEVIDSKESNDNSDLTTIVQQKLKSILSKEIDLPESRINILEPFEKYGIDSIIIVSLNRVFEKHFGQLSKTLLFEYKNIKELAEYFVKNHKDKFIEEEPKEEKKEKEVVTKSLEKERVATNNRFIKAFNSSDYIVQDDIAIIGVSGRYPESKDLEEFWNNLKEGKDCVIEVPKDRWNHDEYFHPDKNMKGKSYSKWGGFINDVDKFDPLFFGISPKEAEIMGPQERIFLETVWHTIEDGGYTRSRLEQDKVGVFAGVMYNHYTMYAAEESMKGNVLAVNSTYASIANRVSYYLNLTGPSIALDTMCSSSTTAIHLACESIKRGECEAAIAGGVNVTIHPNKYIMLSQGRFAASDGRCRSFGEGGDGYVPGEGVGAVLLKPLKKAIADGDRIYSVIKGTSLNHGGKTNGYSVPNPNAQGELILEALKKAKVNPRTLSYIEAHGTGTSLGDPIEITGLQKAFGEYTNDKQFCSIGSSKSNIGHLESAAGIAAVTKVILQMKYKSLVPSIHSKVLNPNINFENSPFFVQQNLEEWRRPLVNGKEYPRIAGISSFGAGGSNAHIIMEEYIDNKVEETNNSNNNELIIISAKDEERLIDYAKNIKDYIVNHKKELILKDIAYTLQVGRESMEERIAIVVSNMDELINKLDRFIKGDNTNLFRGSIKSRKFTDDESSNLDEISEMLKEEKFEEIAKLWTEGEEINWIALYEDKKTKVISLPVYPFARERYWIPTKDDNSLAITNTSSILHPLVGKNISTVNEQKFISNFTGKEFFFEDHKVKGEKMLPAAAYLEMVRAAGDLSEDNSVTKIKDVLLARPITIDNEPKDIKIGLYPDDEFIEYEVSEVKDNGITTVYSTGKLIYEDIDLYDEIIDIEDFKNDCNLTVSRDECYESYIKLGINYGDRFKVIDELYVSENKSISKFSINTNEEQFKLHPSILDGMLQSVIGVGYDNDSLYLPFAIGELVIIKPTIDLYSGYIVTELIDEEEDTRKYNIILVDEKGNVFIKINDFTVKSFDKKVSGVKKSNLTNLDIKEADYKELDLKEILHKVYNGEIDDDNIIKLMEELI